MLCKLCNVKYNLENFHFFLVLQCKQPPVKSGGIAWSASPVAYGDDFHPSVETGGIKIGRIKYTPPRGAAKQNGEHIHKAEVVLTNNQSKEWVCKPSSVSRR